MHHALASSSSTRFFIFQQHIFPFSHLALQQQNRYSLFIYIYPFRLWACLRGAVVEKNIVVVRGGGSLATGVIQKLHRSGFFVLCLESPQPTAILRSVSVCEAAYDGYAIVEDLCCVHVQNLQEVKQCHNDGAIPLVIDPDGQWIADIRPYAVVDATCNGNHGATHRSMAPVTIGLGAGFTPGQDVDAAVQTTSGHNLGRVYYDGGTLAGNESAVSSQAMRQTVYAPIAGVARPIKQIGDIAHEGEAIMVIEQHFIKAPITGIMRGAIRPGLAVPQGAAVALLDAAGDVDTATLPSDARAVGGGTLEALFYLRRQWEKQHG